MIAPPYRRPPNRLSPEDITRLVRMREQGATWKEIGRTFAKQDGACKSIFDKAKGCTPPGRGADAARACARA